MRKWAARTPPRPGAAPVSRALAVVIGIMAGVAFMPANLGAQVQPPASARPFRGLFGGVAGASDRPQSLDFTASVYAAYDDDIFSRGTGARPQDQRLAGTFVGSQAALAYSKLFSTAAFSATASTSLRWLTDSGEFVPTLYTGTVGYSKQINSRTTFSLAQSAGYNPRLAIAPLDGASTIGPTFSDDTNDLGDLSGEDSVSGSPGDFAIVASRDVIFYSGQARISRSLSSRSSLSFSGGYGLADFRDEQFRGVSNRRYRGAGRYSYSLTRNLSARLGYGYQTFRTRDGVTNDNHNIDAGLSFGQPFVFGRNRTRLAFSTGTNLQVRDRLDADEGSRVVVRAIGNALLTHDFRSSWQARLAYSRSVGFIDGLVDPLLRDRVTASLGGLLTTRLDLIISAGHLSGSTGRTSRSLRTSLASVRSRLALTSSTAFFVQYFYYHYDYDQQLADQLVIPPALERQGIRAGLTVWLPLLR